MKRAWRLALAGVTLATVAACSTPFSGPESDKLERVWKERVSTYTYRPEEFSASEIARLGAVLALLPQGTRRPPSATFRSEYRGDAVSHLSFELSDRAVHAWLHTSARRDSEFNIMYTNPRRESEPYMYEHGRCDLELVHKAPSASMDPLIRASVQFRRLPDAPWILGVQLVLCDVPDRRDRADALRFFLDSVFSPVEAVLGDGPVRSTVR